MKDLNISGRGKNCIFHIPFKINENNPSGSQIRPIKMLEAFEDIGYDIDVVMGTRDERDRQIKNIRDKIKKGVKYDFLYSESSTYPTLRTEKRISISKMLIDFGLFRICKKNGIKIGLFYRDIYWMFPLYDTIPLLKRVMLKKLYKYDLIQYKKYLDILYLPTSQVYEHIPFSFKGTIDELPPGVEKNILFNKHNISSSNINVFYVGGVSLLYNIEMIFKATQELEFINLTICCRENEWKDEKSRYEKYLNARISIVHESGKSLQKYYEESDIVYLFIEPSEYRNMAMPVKLFEYISYGKPILATNISAADKFIGENDIGWNIEYNYDALVNTLKHIYENQNEILRKSENMKKIIPKNTWEARARKVASDLTNLK